MPETPPITLRGAKLLRESPALQITAKQMSRLTGIALPRLTLLESINVHKAEEPWLAEAHAVCQVLRCDLMTAIGGTVDNMRDLDTGYDLQDAYDVWLTGVPLPLRYGIRLAVRFGFDDPFDLLDVPTFYRRVWTTLEQGERLGSPGICPYCAATITPPNAIVGSAGHLPSCTPAMLFAVRDRHLSIIGTAPKPWRPHVARGGSKYAPGLAAVRKAAGSTQEVFAQSLGIAGTTYYRLEKMRDRLTLALAEKIAATYKVTLSDIYSA